MTTTNITTAIIGGSIAGFYYIFNNNQKYDNFQDDVVSKMHSSIMHIMPPDTYIGGSYALHKFLRSRGISPNWTSSDIDIFTSLNNINFKTIDDDIIKQADKYIQEFEKQFTILGYTVFKHNHELNPPIIKQKDNVTLRQKKIDDGDPREDFHDNILAIVKIYIKNPYSWIYDDFVKVEIVMMHPLYYNRQDKPIAPYDVLLFNSLTNVIQINPYSAIAPYYRTNIFGLLYAITDYPTRVLINKHGEFKLFNQLDLPYIVGDIPIPKGNICKVRRLDKYTKRGYIFEKLPPIDIPPPPKERIQ